LLLSEWFLTFLSTMLLQNIRTTHPTHTQHHIPEDLNPEINQVSHAQNDGNNTSVKKGAWKTKV
jgi:hypothetical protein